MRTLLINRLRDRRRRIKKDDPAERARIEALLQDYYSFVREQFALFVSSVRDPATLQAVEDALQEGRLDDAFAIVDSFVARLGDGIISQIPDVGRREAEAIAEGVQGAGVAVSFNPSSPEVVDAMRRNRLEFVTNFTNEQRAVVGQALTTGVQEGLGPAAIARDIRDTIGLTPYQNSIVDSYRAALESGSRDALQRALRDRRFDPTVEAAIDSDDLLDEDRIDVMVDRYRDRMLQMRGETIARTESLRSGEEVREISARQAMEAAGFEEGTVVKQWQAVRDARTRDTHSEMDGQARLIDDAFDSPSGAALARPGDSSAPADEVINCRCTVAYHFFNTPDEAMAFLLENGQGYYEDGV